jgi:hypothetical protein
MQEKRIIIIIIIIIKRKNKMQAIGTFTVPVLRYSFGIINWHQEEIRKVDRTTRKMLTIHRQHHPRADIDRLYFPRKEVGRGVMQVEGTYRAETRNLVEYVERRLTDTNCKDTPT